MPIPYSGVAPFVNPSPNAGPYSVNIHPGYADFRAPALKSSLRATSGSRGDRGKITAFSPAAKRNFLKNVFSLAALPDLFATLTYPNFYPADPETWKRHLDNFVHAFRRRFPESWFIWKLEPQKRGAPHFHLLGSLGVRANIVLLRKFIAGTWFRVVGSGDVKHLRAGVQTDFVNDSFGKVKRYVCKYVGKSACASVPEWAAPGRWWGIVGREKLPATPCCHVLLPRDVFFKLRRLVRKWMAHFKKAGGYSKRLRKLASFFILAGHEFLFRLLECSLGFSLPQADGPMLSSVLDFESIPF